MPSQSTLKNSPLAWECRRLLRRTGFDPRHPYYSFYREVVPFNRHEAIVDVGANSGGKTEIFRTLAPRVIAVEPDPASADTLRNRFKWRREVTVRETAISDVDGSLNFYQFGGGSAYNSASPEWVESLLKGSNHMGLTLPTPKQIVVPTTTLQSIVTDFWPIKYIKIDVEGFEQKVLSTLSTPIPLISLEFNLPEAAEQLRACVTLLRGLGDYEFNGAIAEPPLKLEFERWCSATDCLQRIDATGWRYIELYARLSDVAAA